MLKGIPDLISPELMNVLMKMGHGDEIVLGDGNFPADSNAQRIVRCDGHDAVAVLDAILQFFPIDTFVDEQAMVMQPVDADAGEPPIWARFRESLARAEQRDVPLTLLERFTFYERARTAYAIVSTSESALYANIILKKGVITAS